MPIFVTCKCYYANNMERDLTVTINVDAISSLEYDQKNQLFGAVHMKNGDIYNIEPASFGKLSAVVQGQYRTPGAQ